MKQHVYSPILYNIQAHHGHAVQLIVDSVSSRSKHRLAALVSSIWSNVGLDTHPLSNFIHPQCSKRARAGQGKPLLN